VTFLTVGDVMLSRNVAATMKDAGDPLLPFRPTAALLASVDFVFGNLESPFSGGDHFVRSSDPTNSVLNAPRANLQGLSEHHFKILNLANNHVLDQGLGGLRYTREQLKARGIKTIGAGDTLDEAWAPEVVEAQGIKVGFVGASYTSVNDNGKSRNRYVARMDDRARLTAAIGRSRAESDFVVVTMHAGTEYSPRPNRDQVEFAHAAIDLGADIVFGAHPHVIQPVEVYRGKYIFYSLGNFIFDHETKPTKEGLAVKTSLRARAPGHEQGTPAAGGRGRVRLESLEILPVVIENHSTPRLATRDEASSILSGAGIPEAVIRPAEEKE
jgi:poly-gamma-glutamate synthesis protein (capsule biosynthesis protein)